MRCTDCKAFLAKSDDVDEILRQVKWRAMEVSVRMLGERGGDEPLLKDATHRFVELAVFPTDVPIPEAAVLTLWSHTSGLSERHGRKLLVLLQKRSLVQLTRTTTGTTMSLHDLFSVSRPHGYEFRLARKLRRRGDAGSVGQDILVVTTAG